MNGAAYIDRAKRRHWFACPCGARRQGRDLTWPAWAFKVTVYRACPRPAGRCLHRFGHSPAAPVPVKLGPYPPETPVCPTHTLEKVAP